MECTITNLRRATEYSITVQAFNNKGAGPPSKDTYVKTHENGIYLFLDVHFICNNFNICYKFYCLDINIFLSRMPCLLFI